jgi:tRNA/tmRNA/rRNA uracil-C5-methylase (TrmA/RlmC/RlmD family)
MRPRGQGGNDTDLEKGAGVVFQAGQVTELVLGEAAHGGWCVARPEDGPVVFVRHGLPGERVRARITDVTAKFARADAEEILVASPDRVEPPCPHARPGACGGCDWQHASLPAQRALKAAVVAQQLRRLAGIEREVTVEPLDGDGDQVSDGDHVRDDDNSDGDNSKIGGGGGGYGDNSKRGLGWRTRVQFAVRSDGVAGLRAHRSHDVVDVGECLIAHPAVTGLGLTTRRWPSPAGGGVRSVEGVVGDEARAVIVSGGKTTDSYEIDAGAAVLRRNRNGGMTALRGRNYLSQRAAGREWRVSVGGFWQVHPGAADALAAAVLAALEPRAGDCVLDLYCGAGLFAGVLAEAVGQGGTVIGVESEAAAVRDARHNLPDWARVHRGDVSAVLRRGGLPEARLVVADPPRAGLAREVIEYIDGAERFAYVSCDPATLARDIALLTARGWTLTDLRAFDAFPMTHHVECVATLVRD